MNIITVIICSLVKTIHYLSLINYNLNAKDEEDEDVEENRVKRRRRGREKEEKSYMLSDRHISFLKDYDKQESLIADRCVFVGWFFINVCLMVFVCRFDKLLDKRC